jgi:riboflavin synthase
MFTGIIRTQGTLTHIEHEESGAVLFSISNPNLELHEGDSVSVNGVCLTVLDHTSSAWTARLMQETLSKTTLGQLGEGSSLNLELPVASGERMHGHIVQGHVDGTGKLVAIIPKGDDRIYEIEVSSEIISNITAKGSVALDGVSLTVVDVKDTSFTVSLMPYTLEHTTLGAYQIGSLLNVETDKHVRGLWVSGVVAEGDKRGTGLGFPTANITLHDASASIAEGIFAVRAMIANDPTIYAGALHVGPRPTFPGASASVELHLINFAPRNLYNETISFTVIEKIRDVQKFDSVEALIAAIKQDVEQATNILLTP